MAEVNLKARQNCHTARVREFLRRLRDEGRGEETVMISSADDPIETIERWGMTPVADFPGGEHLVPYNYIELRAIHPLKTVTEWCEELGIGDKHGLAT